MNSFNRAVLVVLALTVLVSGVVSANVGMGQWCETISVLDDNYCVFCFTVTYMSHSECVSWGGACTDGWDGGGFHCAWH